jgi:hypothetical protein
MRKAAAIISDIEARAQGGPVEDNLLRGHAPMRQLTVWGYRVLHIINQEVLWVLEICKKQDQDAAIERAAKRTEEVLEG